MCYCRQVTTERIEGGQFARQNLPEVSNLEVANAAINLVASGYITLLSTTEQSDTSDRVPSPVDAEVAEQIATLQQLLIGLVYHQMGY